MRRQKAEGRRQSACGPREALEGSAAPAAPPSASERGWGPASIERSRIRQRVGTVLTFVLLVVLMCANGAPLLAQQQPQRTPAQEGFVPVDRLPAQERLPATPLVIGAYAIAWVAVFGYLISIWTRLGKVEREILAVSRRIESEGRR